jgi:hypothetical protein
VDLQHRSHPGHARVRRRHLAEPRDDPRRNLADLRRHAEDFAQRAGFTYTVLARGSDRIIGCVYIYPWRGEEGTADVQSWVRAERADLDASLHDAVAAWLDNAWPFTVIRYASR